MQRGVLIVPVSTLMQRVCPHSFLHGHALVMKKGQRLSRDALRDQLEGAGYRHVDQVMEHGEYATRGALLDLFPMGSDQPYRLDFFDDEIDSLRLFDVDSQRRWRKWRPLTCCRRTSSPPTRPLLSCSAASGATALR